MATTCLSMATFPLLKINGVLCSISSYKYPLNHRGLQQNVWTGRCTLVPQSSKKQFVKPKMSPILPVCKVDEPSSSSKGPASFAEGDWDAAWKFLQKGNQEEASSGASSNNSIGASSKNASEKSSSNNFEILPSLSSKAEVKKQNNGPRLTQWGGSVRGGEFKMGEGTDRILDLWGNGNAMLIGAGAIILLFIVLCFYIPPPPTDFSSVP